MPGPIHRLVIVSHVCHYRFEGRLHAYGPYAKEIDIWADLFAEVVIAAPCRQEAPPGDAEPFTRSNISLARQFETGGDTLGAKIAQAVLLPVHVWTLCGALRRADAIHVRCPGNLGLLGVCLAPLWSRYLIAKYAGQWSDYPGMPWTWRLQRTLLVSPWWRGPVTVYGRRPTDPPKVTAFFTSVLNESQVARARRAASRRQDVDRPLRVLSVGRLTRDKNVDVLISAVADLRDRGVAASCRIVGEGPERAALEAQVIQLGLADRVTFAGGVTLEHVLEYYEDADALVLASETEGWPKAIAEGMAFGLVCIGSDRGLMPSMLSNDRGIVVPPRDVDAIASALIRLDADPVRFSTMRRRAAEWAQQHSVEELRVALADLMTKQWGLSADTSLQPASAAPMSRRT